MAILLVVCQKHGVFQNWLRFWEFWPTEDISGALPEKWVFSRIKSELEKLGQMTIFRVFTRNGWFPPIESDVEKFGQITIFWVLHQKNVVFQKWIRCWGIWANDGVSDFECRLKKLLFEGCFWLLFEGWSGRREQKKVGELKNKWKWYEKTELWCVFFFFYSFPI